MEKHCKQTYLLHTLSILCNTTQFEDKCRNKSYVKSEMRRHLVVKLGIYLCLRYDYSKSLFSVLSSKKLVYTYTNSLCFNMTS